jgi:class 3 adenylate cyclase
MTTIAMAVPAAQAAKHFGTLMVGRFEGFPSLVRAVGAPAMPDFARRVHEMLDHYVRQYKGAVVQAKGDGIVALFTAGDGDDNHAARALGAAVAIRRAFAGEYMTVRTSVHSGYVTVPETLGIARGLGDAAGDNHIIASDQTVGLAREQFEFESVGRHEVGGVGEVEVFDVLAVARNHAGKLSSYLHHELEPHADGEGGEGDSVARNFPVLGDIIQSVRR